MYIELLADIKEDIDQSKPMLVFFCVPHDTEAIRANIRFLVGQLGKTRHYISPNPNARFKYTAERLDGLEVNFMCQELLERLVKSVEEIEYTNKAHLAQLRGDKKVKYYIDKPTAPTTEVPNPQITVASDSVFQVSSLLENSNITEILTTALLDDGTIGLPDLNPFNLESKIDKIRTDIGDAKSHFVGDFHGLMQWFAGSFRGGLFSDINPFGKETMFDRFTKTFNLPFIGGGITTSFWELHHKTFMQSDTVGHSNSWFAKLGDISSISGWLTADDGRLKVFFENITQIRDYLDYHLGELQYGIKHFFNIFAVPTGISDIDPDLKGHKIPKEWPKPNAESQIDLIQNSVFQHTQDDLGRGFTLHDWLVMWVKPHGESANGLGYTNPYTNRKGHELVTGSNEQIDTFINRFSLAFLQTSNTTPILGKIRDILETGLLFSSGLGILTLINNSLQSIYGVLNIDLGWIARSTEEIAAKDCCEGANTNGSTTVTNPDGTTTTTPNQPTYPPIDPSDPNSPTTEPYERPVIVPPSASDSVCGFIYYWLNWVADWVEFLFNLLDPLQWLYKLLGYTGILDYLPKTALGGVNLQKIPSSKLRGLITSFFTWAGKNADNLNLWKSMLEQIPNLIRAFADDAACGANGQPEPTTNFSAIDSVAKLMDYIIENNPQFGDGAAFVGQAAMIAYDYGLFNLAGVVDLDDYAQYCPCATPGWPGTYSTNSGTWGDVTITVSGNTATITGNGYNGGVWGNNNGPSQGTGTISPDGMSITGTWTGRYNNDPNYSGEFTLHANPSFTGFGGSTTSQAGTYGFSGNRIV